MEIVVYPCGILNQVCESEYIFRLTLRKTCTCQIISEKNESQIEVQVSKLQSLLPTLLICQHFSTQRGHLSTCQAMGCAVKWQLKHLFISQWEGKKRETIMRNHLLHSFHCSSRCFSRTVFLKVLSRPWTLSEMQILRSDLRPFHTETQGG